MKALLFIFFLISCSNIHQKALNSWKGHSVEELKSHPYFSEIPPKKTDQSGEVYTLTFDDDPRYGSSAYCGSLGGCMGYNMFSCEISFQIKDKVIVGVKENGSCPDAEIIRPKGS